MANTPAINNFNAGELSPYLYSRNDLKKYNSGCLTLENFQALPYGGAVRRPAIKYIAETKNNENVKLIEFERSSGNTFVLEFGAGYIRFFKDGAPVLDGGSPYEVTGTVYSEADLPLLRVVQSADVMWLVHPSHPVQRLSRFSDTNWTIAEDVLGFKVFREQNVTSATMTYTGALTAGTTGAALAASEDTFDGNHVGSYWEIKHPRDALAITTYNATSGSATVASPSGTGSSIAASAGVRVALYTRGTWTANCKIAIWRSEDDGSTWEQFRFYDMSERNVDTSWTEGNTKSLYVITKNNVSVGTGVFTFTVDEAYDTGVVEITTVTDAQTAVVTVITAMGKSGVATTKWSEGAWSDFRGYPSVVALWESRLIFANTLSDPNTIWLSTVDDYSNFNQTTLDDASMTLTLNSGRLDEIRWLVPQSALVIGTTGSEWALTSISDNKPVTPSEFSLKRKTTYGSNSYVPGVMVNSAILFVMRQGRKIREFVFNWEAQDYVAPDLTILAEHITEGGVIGAAYQQQPDNNLICIRADGTMIPMTYERDQDVTGWQRWVNDEFTFEDVAILPRDDDEDEVYVSCKLTVDGTVKRYIGIFDSREWGTDIATEWAGADFYSVFTSPATTTLSGLDYLEGKTVDITRDGMVEPQRVVTGGEVTITKAGQRIVVGLPYRSTMAPMYIEPASQFVQPLGKHKGVFKAVVRFKDTIEAKVGQTLGSLTRVKFRTTADTLDTQVDLFSGEKKVNFDNTYELLHTCYIVQDKPLPMTVVAMVPWVEVHE